jgi:putative RNA 2'-phosphotransferase
MIEHADAILRYLSAHDQEDISTTATAAMHARRRYDKERVSVSKAAAKILRHDSLRVGPDGWMDTVDLRAMLEEWAAGASRRLRLVRHKRVEEALCFPSEDRFEVSKDLSRIRALHGHTISNYAKLRPSTPPPLLFHGTSEEAWIGIRSGGLTPEGRRSVHIFVEKGNADPVLLIVDTTLATQMGVVFRQSNESVWVADCVPAACLTICRGDDNSDL